MLESLLLLRYLWIVYAHGETCQVDEHGPPAKPNRIGWLGHGRVIEGRHAGVAILVGLKPAVITCSKTAMYCELLSLSSSRRSGEHEDAGMAASSR